MPDRNVEEQLEGLGSVSGPTIDPAFADRLDADLRIMHVDQEARPRSRSLRIPAVAAAAVLLVAVAGTLVLSRSESSEVVMTVASDTEVYLQQDRSIPGSAGLHLPDGARIVVGSDGQAVVDGVVLAPGTEAVVVGDRIDVLVVAAVDRPSDAQPPTTSDQPGDRVVVVPSSASPPASDPSTPTDRTVSDRPAGSTTIGDRPGSRPAPTTRPATSPSTRPSSTDTTASTSRPVPSTTDRPSTSITLTATAISDLRLRLDWVVDRDASPHSWRVKAVRGDRIETVAAIRDGRARSLTVERAAVAGATVWVEAVNRSGQTVAFSNRLAVR